MAQHGTIEVVTLTSTGWPSTDGPVTFQVKTQNPHSRLDRDVELASMLASGFEIMTTTCEPRVGGSQMLLVDTLKRTHTS